MKRLLYGQNNLRFCSNFHHTLIIRHAMVFRKIMIEGQYFKSYMYATLYCQPLYVYHHSL